MYLMHISSQPIPSFIISHWKAHRKRFLHTFWVILLAYKQPWKILAGIYTYNDLSVPQTLNADSVDGIWFLGV